MANRIQQQIRENSMELHDYLRDLQNWEKAMKQKDKHLKESKKEEVQAQPAAKTEQMPPVRGRVKPTARPGEDLLSQRAAATESGQEKAKTTARKPTATSAAHHTYDYFRDKWDKFDVDAALKEVDEDGEKQKAQAQVSTSGRPANGIKAQPSERKRLHAELTPPSKVVSAPDPMEVEAPDATSEKDRGNELFKLGKFSEAMQAYSSSVALQPTAVAFANRAMAAIKLKRYEEAEADCTEALSLDDRYVKAYSRRGTARRELKKYLESVQDFEFALRLEPENKELKKQYTDAKDLCEKDARLRPSASDRAPVRIPVSSHSPAKPIPETAKAVQSSVVRNASHIEALRPVGEVRASVATAPVATSSNPSTSAKAGSSKTEATISLSGQDRLGVQQPQGPASAPHGKAAAARNGVLRGPTAVATAGATEILMKKMADRSDISARSYAELLSLWKAFEGNPPSQAKILRNLDPKALPKIFKDELTPWFIIEIVKNLQNCFYPTEMERATDILEGLTKCSRFDLIARCILPKQKDDVRCLLETTLPDTHADLQTRIDALRRKFMVI